MSISKIVRSEQFKDELKDVLAYISIDSKSRALMFRGGLQAELDKLSHFPYKFRKSIYYENSNVRDLVYKGYVIPYLITDNEIVVLGITKWRDY